MTNPERLNRRELFLRFSPQKNVELDLQTHDIKLDYTLSRRRLMKFVGLLSVTTAITFYLGKETNARESNFDEEPPNNLSHNHFNESESKQKIQQPRGGVTNK